MALYDRTMTISEASEGQTVDDVLTRLTSKFGDLNMLIENSKNYYDSYLFWKFFSKTKSVIPHTQRAENLAWRLLHLRKNQLQKSPEIKSLNILDSTDPPLIPPVFEKIELTKKTSASGMSCHNCLTQTTPLWRRDNEGNPLCNACGLFFKMHKTMRPNHLKSDVIKKRNRQKKHSIDSQSSLDPNQDQFHPNPNPNQHQLNPIDKENLNPYDFNQNRSNNPHNIHMQHLLYTDLSKQQSFILANQSHNQNDPLHLNNNFHQNNTFNPKNSPLFQPSSNSFYPQAPVINQSSNALPHHRQMFDCPNVCSPFSAPTPQLAAYPKGNGVPNFNNFQSPSSKKVLESNYYSQMHTNTNMNYPFSMHKSGPPFNNPTPINLEANQSTSSSHPQPLKRRKPDIDELITQYSGNPCSHISPVTPASPYTYHRKENDPARDPWITALMSRAMTTEEPIGILTEELFDF